MNVTSLADFGERLPTAEEVDSAAGAMMAIETSREADGSLTIGDTKLSPSLVDLMSDLFSIVARGETVTLVPLSRQLTTQEAADLLNVSRPFLIKLIDQGALNCEMVGTHRRVALKNVLTYKAKRTAGRRTAMAEMQDIAEDLE
ncbi:MULTISPECIES: helix-turn-helix domain-containing protein [Roseobacteraceae]|uniref:Helix-turn-helix domain protein n=1 Tax=Pseudosulfitobacter pseudonitzschiae TaxID=1402135 RepID=A0A221K8Q4_9RHOB|nr:MULTISPECIES: helix-turn-helix domain-containing protein [Roseobacteraceae]ASM75243.1 helix-turn-helix domain protein [Pseudosulfitobacter pseudonitzschiae]